MAGPGGRAVPAAAVGGRRKSKGLPPLPSLPALDLLRVKWTWVRFSGGESKALRAVLFVIRPDGDSELHLCFGAVVVFGLEVVVVRE